MAEQLEGARDALRCGDGGATLFEHGLHQLARIIVVFDDENREAAQTPHRSGLWHRWRTARLEPSLDPI